MPKKTTLELTELEATALLSAVIRAAGQEKDARERRALERVIDKFFPKP
jgi:hypothetical protein